MDKLTHRAKRVLLLKTVSPFFESVDSLKKCFEVRKNDREFQVDDILMLAQYDPDSGSFTGRYCVRRVRYILEGGQCGIEPDYCVLGLDIYYFDELYPEWYKLLIEQEKAKKMN